MGKYIINIRETTVRIICVGVKDGETYASGVSVSCLMPYTEPDLERVRLEAEQLGMVLAWDAAKKIENLCEAEKFEIFGEYDMFHIMRRYTATEAIEKIRQYEQSQKEKPIRAEDVMRQYLDEFCKRRWCCAECVLRTDDFTCGRGYSFTGITSVSDEEVRRAYAEVMKK